MAADLPKAPPTTQNQSAAGAPGNGSGRLIGGIVGGLLLIALIVVFFVFRCHKKSIWGAKHRDGNAVEMEQLENRRNTMQMEDNPMLAALRAKKTAQTTSHTVMNAAYSELGPGSEQASGDYATIDEVPTAVAGDVIKVVTSSPERSVVGFTNDLYDTTPTSSTVDDGLYDAPHPGINDASGGNAELYDDAPPPTNVISSDDGLYDASPLGSNDEYLTVTA